MIEFFLLSPSFNFAELLIPHIQGTNLVVQNESSFVIDSELAFTYLAFLIERKKPDSFWRPYFDVLPSQFDSTLFWTEEELAVLRGTNLYSTCYHFLLVLF